MVGSNTEYVRSFEDELDWNLIDQLHKVVLQISIFCFRTKQIGITVEIAVIGLLIKFTDNKLDNSIFIAGLLIPVCFWFMDSIAYFYQAKIRGVMNSILKRLKDRNIPSLIDDNEAQIIERKRIDRKKHHIILSAFFNHSMWLYYMLIVADIILWMLFELGKLT